MLRIEGLRAGYGRKGVVFDVSIHVDAGEVVTLLGHNGSGKTTTIKTVLGLFPAQGGRVFYQRPRRHLGRLPLERPRRHGDDPVGALRVPRPDASSTTCCSAGPTSATSPGARSASSACYELFPILRERREQLAGTMSGGQQRMLSLGLLLMAGPKLLMLDEPSLGLAPAIVQQIFDRVRELADEEGMAVLLLEQNVGQALRITDRVYVMRSGRLILEETAEQMRQRRSYWDLF